MRAVPPMPLMPKGAIMSDSKAQARSEISAWLCPDRVFDGSKLLKGHALGVSGGIVAALVPVSDLPAGAARHPIAGTITPGFIDLQVNGGGDVFLNADPTAAGMASIAATHRRFGTVGILPTLISDAAAVLDHAADAAIAAKHMIGLLGLHIESERALSVEVVANFVFATFHPVI